MGDTVFVSMYSIIVFVEIMWRWLILSHALGVTYASYIDSVIIVQNYSIQIVCPREICLILNLIHMEVIISTRYY